MTVSPYNQCMGKAGGREAAGAVVLDFLAPHMAFALAASHPSNSLDVLYHRAFEAR